MKHMKKEYNYEEMLEKTKKFYDSINVKIPDEKIEDALASLTMPMYAKEFNDKNANKKINDHRALATLGDAICGSLLLTKKYQYYSTPKELTFVKKLLKNENLNEKGKQLLKDNLFYSNNDLKEGNKKSYATAFEAVIGFLSLIDIKTAKKVFDDYLC